MGIGVNARTAFSLLFPPILDEFGWERGVTAGAFSFGFLVSAALSPSLGPADGPPRSARGDRAGRGAASASGSCSRTLAREPWHLYVTLGVLVGGGSVCLGYTGQSLYLPNWFVRRRGLAMSLAFSGVGVGSIVLLPWLQTFIARRAGAPPCWTLGLVAAGAAGAAQPAVARGGRRTWPRARRRPGRARGRGARAAARTSSTAAWVAVDWTLARAVRTARFWWIAVGYFCGLFAWYAVQVHQTKYLVEIGFTPVDAAWALGVVSLVGIPGQIALGHLSDRIGREWVWTVGSSASSLCYLALLAAARRADAGRCSTSWCVAQGMLGYGLTSVIGAIPAEIFQGRHYGTIFGTLMLASIAGGAVGPWVTGALYDATGSYALAFWIAIAGCVLSTVAIWFAAPRRVRAVAGQIARLRAERTG